MKKLARELTNGLETTVRRNNRHVFVRNVRGETIAEVCIGKSTTRLNLREPLTEQVTALARGKGLYFTGKSDTWLGGGVKVSSDNVNEVREVLRAVVSAPLEQSDELKSIQELIREAENEGLLDGKELERELTQLLERTLKQRRRSGHRDPQAV